MISNTMILQTDPSRTPLAMFREMFMHGSFQRLWSKFTHRCSHLLDLDETLKDHPLDASHYAGFKTVSIDHIRGTQGKTGEFDAKFNPTTERSRTRWMGIALEKLRGRDLPPVDLIQVGDTYYVRDGHHRISVSRAMGQVYIDAEVTVLRLRQNSQLR